MEKNIRTTKTEAAKPTHTPGPWRIGDAGNTIFGAPNGTPSPDTIAYQIGEAKGAKRANARLIAAAPELLAACRAVVKESELFSGNEPSWVKSCRSAIRRATEGA